MKNEVFKKYKNKHEGKRVFLIANGPSLSKTNLDLIKDEYSIAMNRISLLYNQVEWRPTYYLFSSTNVRPDKPWASKWLSSVWDAIECKKTTPFIASIFKPYIDPYSNYNVNWFDSMSENKPDAQGNIKESCFSTDVIDRIDKTGTTMNLALQLSLHMGFKEIVFVGADLGWTKDLATNNDPNHFSKDYTADIPRPYKANNQMRNVHSLAIKKIHELRPDVNFYNASLSTVLDVYPIIDFEKYVIEGNLTYREKDLENAKQFWDKPPQYSTLT
tara:strand:+ start:436 stop:1254 length:819 start_codon:yes stop_codon:yes gene_type:complete